MWKTPWLKYKGKVLKDVPSQAVDEGDGEVDHDGTFDNDGWQFAPEFGARFSGTSALTDFVRRRKWVRACIKTERASMVSFPAQDVETKKVKKQKSILLTTVRPNKSITIPKVEID